MSWITYTTHGRRRVAPIKHETKEKAQATAARWEKNLIAAGYRVTRRTPNSVRLANQSGVTTIRVVEED